MIGGRYRVVDRVGAGGMADVFRAHDELLARDVAVKVFRTTAVEADTASGAERQQVELHALARLNHPNLITLFDGSLSGADQGPAFLVMELITGPTLAARIAEGPLLEPEVREIGIQIADALAYVHAEGMVHRDVKPANILLGTDRAAGDMTVRARLSDFGIVRLLGSERMTNVDFTVGTASYLAPEQARGADVGPVADVYSLGLVLIEAHTGVRAYEGTPVEAVLARLEHGPDIPAQLPPPWPSLLAAMTATDPDQRPSAAEVARALREVGGRTAPFPLAAAAAVGMDATAAVGATSATGATGAEALADAPTVGLVAAGGSAVVPPGDDDPWTPVDEPRHRRGALWMLAAVLVAALAICGFLLLRPTSHNTPPVDQHEPGAVTHTSHSPSAKSSAHSGSRGSTTTHPSSSAAKPQSSPNKQSTTSAAPSTSAAPRTSAAPSITTAPSSAPPSSSAPATSVAASPSPSPSTSPL